LIPPLIGITAYGPDEDNRTYLPKAYADCVRRAGGVPVIIAPGESRVEALLRRLDGLILAGGGDIAPEFYGGPADHKNIYGVRPERDRMELALAVGARKRRTPTLGTLIPDLPASTVKHRVAVGKPSRHAVRVEPSSRLAKILGTTRLEIASSHHQALDRVARALRTCAASPDGVVEAVELPGHPWFFGVQWHPELTAANDAAQRRLFASLVKASARKRS
jgi:putative glutamine amidotransferase